MQAYDRAGDRTGDRDADFNRKIGSDRQHVQAWIVGGALEVDSPVPDRQALTETFVDAFFDRDLDHLARNLRGHGGLASRGDVARTIKDRAFGP